MEYVKGMSERAVRRLSEGRWTLTYTTEVGGHGQKRRHWRTERQESPCGDGFPERSNEARAPHGNTISGVRQVALVAVGDREDRSTCVGHIDVSSAYFYAPRRRPTHVDDSRGGHGGR